MKYVKIVVFNDLDQMLQCHYLDAREWDLPGRKLEEDEDPRDAAIRGLKETTGYAANGLIFSSIYIDEDNNQIYIFETDHVEKVGSPQTEIRWRSQLNPYTNL